MLQYNYLDMHYAKAPFDRTGRPTSKDQPHRHEWASARRARLRLWAKQAFDHVKPAPKAPPKALRDAP